MYEGKDDQSLDMDMEPGWDMEAEHGRGRIGR